MLIGSRRGLTKSIGISNTNNKSMTVSILSDTKVYGGHLIRFSHSSECTKTTMTAALFLPPNEASTPDSVPLLTYLSGITCTDENVCLKGGAFGALSKHGIAMLCPDTSPRGAGIEGEDASWDFGTGAGMYVDATVQPWCNHYNMYSYVTKEIYDVVFREWPVLCRARMGVFGHSMGGNGAIMVALRNQNLFKSVSAFAPLSNPCESALCNKILTGYLGPDKTTWAEYDSTLLLRELGANGVKYDTILIDQGLADDFYADGNLLPENLKEAGGGKVTLRMHDGYNHGYYFIFSFMEEHIDFHAKRI